MRFGVQTLGVFCNAFAASNEDSEVQAGKNT